MSQKASIDQLLQQPAVWRASHSNPRRPVMATGYAVLDAILHDGGWPQGGVSELLLPRPGAGELQLLRPLCHQLRSFGGYQVWLNAPFVPAADVLEQWGIALDRLICIRSEAIDSLIWAAYQALVSKACSLVLIWLPRRQVSKAHLRKLVLGARQGQGWGVVLRHSTAANEPSPCALRLSLMPLPQGDCQITVLKQPGSWGGQSVTLSLQPGRAFWTPLAAAEWPVFQPSWQAHSESLWRVPNGYPAPFEKGGLQPESSAANATDARLLSRWH